MNDKISELKEIIDNSKRIVFLGGAGVSTESGIPDFRGSDGLYNMKFDYPPELILSHDFFYGDTLEFYKFYRDKMNSLGYKPNVTHYYLSELEKEGKLIGIITQNIDGLHSKAGSKKVLELHGSIMNNYCTKCHKYYDANYVFSSNDIPRCSCGGIIKPDVVLYKEPLPEDIWNEAVRLISMADTLIIGGTSLTVYPAAYLVDFFHGDNLVIINKDKTDYDNRCSLVINDKLGNVFSKL